MQHSVKSSHSCGAVNVTGLQLGTDYVVEVVAIDSVNSRSQPVNFNVSTPPGSVPLNDFIMCVWQQVVFVIIDER